MDEASPISSARPGASRPRNLNRARENVEMIVEFEGGRQMTKFRWENPPKEKDSASYEPDRDPKLRFLGQDDRDVISDRQQVLNRLIDIQDQIEFWNPSSVEKSTPHPGFLTGKDLAEFERLNVFVGPIRVEESAGAAALAARVILDLKAEKVELEARLINLPRNDKF